MNADKEVLVFELDDKLYAFPISQMKEVIALPPCNIAPMMPPYLLGVINYKNSVLPVYSLEKIFGIEQSKKNSLCLIVNSRLGLLGYAIDAVLGIRSLEKATQIEERVSVLPGELRIVSTVQLAMQEKPVHILNN